MLHCIFNAFGLILSLVITACLADLGLDLWIYANLINEDKCRHDHALLFIYFSPLGF